MIHRVAVIAVIAIVSLSPTASDAGESKFLGTLTSTGTSVTNLTTAVPFAVPPGAFLTIYCDASGRLLTDSTSVAATGVTKGLPVSALTYFPTSVGSSNTTTVTISSVVFRTALLAWISTTGTTNCDVWQRAGTE